jgi:hypothetical protein
VGISGLWPSGLEDMAYCYIILYALPFINLQKGGNKMNWYHWALLVGVYGIMIILILTFLRGANPWEDSENPIQREDEYGRRI